MSLRWEGGGRAWPRDGCPPFDHVLPMGGLLFPWESSSAPFGGALLTAIDVLQRGHQEESHRGNGRGCVEKTEYAVFDENVWKRRRTDAQRSREQQSEERSEWSGVHLALLSGVGR